MKSARTYPHRVMSILNVTPDSFYAASRANHLTELRGAVERMVAEGADIIDIGGYSTRPGADDVAVQEEIGRVLRGVEVRSVARWPRRY